MDVDAIISSIKAITKFKDYDDETLRALINDAQAMMDFTKLPYEIQPIAIRLFVCHWLLQQQQVDSGIESKTLSALEISYSSYASNSDPYYQLLKDLLRRYGLDGSQAKAWTTD